MTPNPERRYQTGSPRISAREHQITTNGTLKRTAQVDIIIGKCPEVEIIGISYVQGMKSFEG